MQPLYLTLCCAVKLVMLCFYMRLFPLPLFRTCCLFTIAFVAATCVSLVIADIFQCSPIRYHWDGWRREPDLANAKCINLYAFLNAGSFLFIIQDVIVLVLPIPLLVKLNTTWQRKAGIICMFSIGIFVTATSCVRLRYIIQYRASTNPTWDSTDTVIVSIQAFHSSTHPPRRHLSMETQLQSRARTITNDT